MLVGYATLGIIGSLFLGIESLNNFHGLIMLTSGFTAGTLHFVVMFFYYKTNSLKTSKYLIENDFETRIINEEQKKSGFISYDESGKIIFITEHLIRKDFKNLLGKHVSTLQIEFDEGTRTIKEINGSSYKFITNKRRRIIHVIDNSEIDRLEKMIKQKQHVVTVVRLDYSDKIKYNAGEFAKISSKINEILHTYAELTDGTLSHSHTGDEVIIVSE
jgi:c-di-AMP phosphodiesterase-like protein